MKKMTSFEGDTGVYLQYAHVRLASMERKNPNVVLPEDTSLVQTDLLVEDRAHDIVYLLALYPDVVRTAYNLSEPSTIVTFAFRLAHAISGAWDGRTSRACPPPASLPRRQDRHADPRSSPSPLSA
jgi:arginyl-tRNA synthetase